MGRSTRIVADASLAFRRATRLPLPPRHPVPDPPAMDLERALAFSHYARQALAAPPGAARRARRRARTRRSTGRRADAALDAAVDAGDAGRARIARCARCAGACSLHTMLRDLTGARRSPKCCAAISTLADVAARRGGAPAHAQLAADARRAASASEPATPQALDRDRRWASSAAASSTCRRTSTSSSPIPRKARPTAPRRDRQPRVLRPARPARHRRAGRRHRRRLRVPRRHAAATLRRKRAADRRRSPRSSITSSRRAARGSATRG